MNSWRFYCVLSVNPPLFTTSNYNPLNFSQNITLNSALSANIRYFQGQVHRYLMVFTAKSE
ncbi:hypothetical protein PFLA_a2289 [Pseudoalteromonas flavipulchra NCIMB 2033 = ATCC BAA-314]|nr:hypothetical protein [Pseudoalteromonas flavipulchra NCIMB 2033 = ATCC BAA-314]